MLSAGHAQELPHVFALFDLEPPPQEQEAAWIGQYLKRRS
jgi:hypothetical protein